jgi:hypothetical protein
MQILKQNRRKRIEAGLKRNRSTLQQFYSAVWKLSGGHCEACSGVMHEAHHIRYKSQQGKDIPENGLGLCRTCHLWAHQGKVITVPKDDGHGSTTERLSGRQFILRLLDSKVNQKGYRWADVHEYLRRTAK